MDSLREPRRLVERALDDTGHLREERRQRGGIRALGLPGELQAHGERDQVLMEAIVKLTLDRATIGVRGEDEPPARSTELLELRTQSVELPVRIDFRCPQRDHLPPPCLR